MTKEKLERCGFCGRLFRGTECLSSDETDKVVSKLSESEIESISLGYCPFANLECGGGIGEEEDYETEEEYLKRL